MTLAFEDFKPGHFGLFGPLRVSREDLIAFASEYDPQPMHLDEEAGRQSMLEGLGGSGWHLCALMGKMFVEGFVLDSTSMGSPGIDELRWLSPLRPDTDLTLSVDVIETRISQSKPDRGLVKFRFAIIDAGDITLMTAMLTIFFGRRQSVSIVTESA